MALPPNTYDGLITIGKPKVLEIFNASSFDFAIPLSACLKLFSNKKFLNLSRSSAKSIDLYCVPRIGI